MRNRIIGGVLAASVALVATWEGRSLIAYADPIGIPTICEGYTHGVKMGDVVTPEKCNELTRQEVSKALNVVDNSVPERLPDGMRVAFSSFIYNVGPAAYQRSTLLKRVLVGDYVGACNELTRWTYAGGRKLRGLERRREAEKQICLSSLD